MKKYTSSAFVSTTYGIYKAAMDTITSFPATIYADGENASAVVYGNMQQTGTPTPSSPIQPQECGDLETTGEHSGQYKIPILSDNTTTNIYIGQVQTTRKIKKLVLTGNEDWSRTANEKCYYINSAKGCPQDYMKSNIITVICTHYAGQANTSSGSNEVNEGCICFFTGGGFELFIGESTITTAEDFKDYLQQQYAANTPVTLWYVLAEQTTGILNEPLRKIGVYADTVTATIPTIAAADNINVTTTLKPSAVDLTYTGWHKYDDKKRSGGAWT